MKVKQIIITAHPPGTGKSYKKPERFFDTSGNKIALKELKRVKN